MPHKAQTTYVDKEEKIKHTKYFNNWDASESDSVSTTLQSKIRGQKFQKIDIKYRTEKCCLILLERKELKEDPRTKYVWDMLCEACGIMHITCTNYQYRHFTWFVCVYCLFLELLLFPHYTVLGHVTFKQFLNYKGKCLTA